MTAAATPLASAMVRVTLSAPCAMNERLTVHHHGLRFTMTTDSKGALDMVLPALKKQAVFILAFSNGDGAVAHTQVQDLEHYDRVAVHWRGAADFQLHAREFGADYGTPGHVWSGAISDGDDAKPKTSGQLVVLGDPRVADPLQAEVYTFPSGLANRNGTINLSVEAEVTSSNCDQTIEAQSIEVTDGKRLKKRDLTLTLPDCGAIGSFLVLNNLVADMKVAAN